MSGGGNLERVVESNVLDAGEVFHECDEPRVQNLLGPRQDDTQATEESCPDWQFQQNLRRLARSLSPSGIPVTPDSDEEEIALGSAEENAKHYRTAWKQARE